MAGPSNMQPAWGSAASAANLMLGEAPVDMHTLLSRRRDEIMRRLNGLEAELVATNTHQVVSRSHLSAPLVSTGTVKVRSSRTARLCENIAT